MDVHDKMVKELFDNKSLEALVYLIEQGRELEFNYNNKACFISKDHSRSCVSIWIEKDEQSFGSVEELIKHARIDNMSFEDIWKLIELGILY